MKIEKNKLVDRWPVLVLLLFCIYLMGCGKTAGSGQLYDYCSDEDSTIVYLYMLGTNLETAEGKASWSLDQICRATAAGDKLTVIMEAGGTKNWKNEKLLDNKTGRYIIRNGSIDLVMDLGDADMMDESELSDFLYWSGEEFTAGDARSMLLFWDHGGGTGGGFGMDEVHENSSISVKELQNGISTSKQTFDIIGFDACLMQTVEIAAALSPFGKYLLASEEREPGYGWYYTAGFEKLAKGSFKPEENLRDFGIEMVQLYTKFYKEQGHGNGVQTLSLVDMKKASEAYEAFVDTLADLDTSIIIDREVYSDISMSRSKAHEFCDGRIDQIDLLDFLDKYSQKSGTDLSGIKKLTEECIIYNSEEAPDGANGIAVYFPYRHAEIYQKICEDLGEVKGSSRRILPLYSKFLSIIVGINEATDSDSARNNLRDYSDEKWYSEEAANVYRQDFGKLEELFYDEENDYYIQPLTEVQKELLTDTRFNFFFETPEDGHLFDMGSDILTDWTEDGEEPVIDFPEAWVCVNDVPVAIYSDPIIEHDEEFWLSALSPAILNDTEEINVKLSWGPILYEDMEKDLDTNGNGINDAIEITGMVAGYESAENTGNVFLKGLKKFKSGDKISFTYDEYDDKENYVGSAELNDPIIISDDSTKLEVTYSLLDGTGTDYLVWLTLYDLYRRSYDTEVLSYIDEE